MAEANFENRTLYQGDNLDFLRGMNSETVDLIATDPPFNKGVKAFEGITEAGTNISYSDVWTWGDVQDNWTQSIRLDHPNLYAVIRAANAAAGEDMGAFLCWLGVRVMEMHRVLREDGSLYLHIDHTAHAYVRAMMDGIFGREQFRNEIVWQRASGRAKGSQHAPKTYGTDTDFLLYYAKSPSHRFNASYAPLSEDEADAKFPHQDKRGRYNTSVPLFRQPSMGARPNLCFEYNGVRNPHPSGWRVSREKLAEMDARDEIIWRDGNRPLRKSYLDAYKGRPRGNLWTDVPNLTSSSERTGYPTQKPLALYERIIRASSNPGDLVLDPFSGCATTCVGAERLGRRWVGMDINKEAEQVTLERLKREVDAALNWGSKVSMLKDPPTRTDDGEEAAPELTLVSPRPAAPRLTARQLREQLIAAHGKICQGCGWTPHHEEYLESDHRVPKSRDGRDDLRNRVLLCSPCNSAKGNRLTLAELRLGRLQQDRMADKNWDMAWYERTGKSG